MARTFSLHMDGAEYAIESRGRNLLVNGRSFEPQIGADGVRLGAATLRVEISGDTAFVDGVAYPISAQGLRTPRRGAPRVASGPSHNGDGALTAIMPGLIIKVLVAEGATVSAGDVVVVLEAMKMENEICSPKDGVVREIRVREGDSVTQNQVLAIIA